jgi:hypothetical protein
MHALSVDLAHLKTLYRQVGAVHVLLHGLSVLMKSFRDEGPC